MLLTRDEILQAEDLPTEDVPVPEWGGVVRVRGLTGAERDAFEAAVFGPGSSRENIRAHLVARSVVDENGDRIFSDRDVMLLGRKSAVALQRVFNVAMRLSGLRNEDVEELAKNSVSGQSDDSTSD